MLSIVASAGMRVVGAETTLTDRHHREAELFMVDADIAGPAEVADFLRSANAIGPSVLLMDVDSPLARSTACVNGSILIDRRSPIGTLLDEMDRIRRGEIVPTSVCNGTTETPVPRLSQRERQVLQEISLGRTNGQIARRLSISTYTVDTYLKRIRGKLQLGNKADLTRAAMTLCGDIG
ncbi:helix-turn-helix transcriptional regulator [Nonomuraea sp. SMC257]|uniref:Helix-turn-helix transcriptional regulator n=1 Tax=Nonomuraea montanisoli TaxID=2741721 RepID=A0A7Y6M4Q3_9ACTN|nr:LuxR C-terminal-related transcriptional regulator [Nonomuraea montanisoli]NUW34547.1 helix-turn-helix transcriptional regulator [Nonomuraea montanisoli]